MIARLPMYDWPELKEQHAAMWRHLAGVLREDLPAYITVPELLTEDGDIVQQWCSPDLLVGQTCGLPFAQGLYKQTALLGSPVYRLAGCDAGEYNSVIVAAPGVNADAVYLSSSEISEPSVPLRAAVNTADSQSGFSALLYSLAAGTFGSFTVSGSHRRSVQMLAAGEADIATIDAVSWALAQRYEPAAEVLQVIGFSEPTPCLPMISGVSRYAGQISQSLMRGMAALDETLKTDLLLEGLVERSVSDYLFLSPRLTGAMQKHGLTEVSVPATA